MEQCDSIVVLVSEAPIPPKLMLPLSEALLSYSHEKEFQAGVLVDSFSHQQESGHEVMDSDDSSETLLGIGALLIGPLNNSLRWKFPYLKQGWSLE